MLWDAGVKALNLVISNYIFLLCKSFFFFPVATVSNHTDHTLQVLTEETNVIFTTLNRFSILLNQSQARLSRKYDVMLIRKRCLAISLKETAGSGRPNEQPLTEELQDSVKEIWIE